MESSRPFYNDNSGIVPVSYFYNLFISQFLFNIFFFFIEHVCMTEQNHNIEINSSSAPTEGISVNNSLKF